MASLVSSNIVITKKELGIQISQAKKEYDNLVEKIMEIDDKSEIRKIVELIMNAKRKLKSMKIELDILRKCPDCNNISEFNICLTKKCFTEWLKTTKFDLDNIYGFLQIFNWDYCNNSMEPNEDCKKCTKVICKECEFNIFDYDDDFGTNYARDDIEKNKELVEYILES